MLTRLMYDRLSRNGIKVYAIFDSTIPCKQSRYFTPIRVVASYQGRTLGNIQVFSSPEEIESMPANVFSVVSLYQAVLNKNKRESLFDALRKFSGQKLPSRARYTSYPSGHYKVYYGHTLIAKVREEEQAAALYAMLCKYAGRIGELVNKLSEIYAQWDNRLAELVF